VPPGAIQISARLVSLLGTQGLLALGLLEACAFISLFFLYRYLYQQLVDSFLRYWIVGWGLLTVYGIARLAEMRQDGVVMRVVVESAFFAALACFLASVLDYRSPGCSIKVPWTIGLAGTAVVGSIAALPNLPGWLKSLPPVLDGIVLLTTIWVLSRSGTSVRSHGPKLLGAALLLAGFHYIDLAILPWQQFFWLDEVLSNLLQIALGVGAAVLVLDAARTRVDDLDEKLRRLTLITAASTQTLSVDQVLQEVLGHLVETINATHGLVRVLTGEGDEAQFEIRAAVGFTESYIQEQRRLPADEHWLKSLLAQKSSYVCLDQHMPAALRLRMKSENVSALVLVRLPGKEAPLGVLCVGSQTPRRFQSDELSFLVNVANLLGLTIQNVRLFGSATLAQRQWSYTFDSIGDPILVHDDAGRILRANQAFADTMDRSRESLLGWQLSDIFAAKPPATWTSCPYCEGFAGKGDTPDPYLGGFLLAANSSFHDQEGNRLGVVHVLRDISERQLAEDKYRSLFENVQEGVFISTPEGRFVDFNDAFLQILGYATREELLRVQDIAASIYVDPGDRDRLKKLLKEHGSVTNYEFRMRRRDGEILTVMESSIATRDAAGNVLGYQGFVLDVTERKRAELEIRRRNRELMVLNSIGQTLNQPLGMQDISGRVLRQVVELFSVDIASIFLIQPNSTILQILAGAGFRSGYDRNFPPLAIPQDLFEHIRAVHATVLSAAGLPLPAAFRDFEQKEGLNTSYLVLLWSKGDPIGCLLLGCRQPREFSNAELNLLASVSNQIAASIEKISLLDETRKAYEDLRHTQEQLLQSEKMAAIGQLISGVAHELNNPLTAILGYSQLLSSGEFVNKAGAEYSEKIYKQARRTHRIVNNLLSFARQQKPERLPVQINQVIEDTLSLREYDLRINNIQIHRSFPTGLSLLSGDPHQLQQVFLNILNNAVDAILERSDRGDIWIRTAQESDHLLVEIVDSGLGVENPHRVFDPFYTTKAVGKGTGLGLSICYGIISEHGGEILVNNLPPRGAAFTVVLPVIPVGEASRAETEHEELALPGRVLLVDDEEAVLSLEKEILESRSIKVVTASNGQEALAQLAREQVDLVVTDLKMPGEITGRALYEWIRKHRPDLEHRVVFTMSGAQVNGTVEFLQATGVPYIQKPFEVEKFWSLVQKVLRQREAATLKS